MLVFQKVRVFSSLVASVQVQCEDKGRIVSHLGPSTWVIFCILYNLKTVGWGWGEVPWQTDKLVTYGMYYNKSEVIWINQVFTKDIKVNHTNITTISNEY